jgi:ClpP class serine protease
MCPRLLVDLLHPLLAPAGHPQEDAGGQSSAHSPEAGAEAKQPVVSILKVIEQKPIAEVDDQALIWADVASKAIKQVKRTMVDILSHRMEPQEARKLTRVLASGNWTHDYPIAVGEAIQLGLSVSTDMPKEVYGLMSLYPQAAQRRPSVEYIPTPYRPPERTRRPSESWYRL